MEALLLVAIVAVDRGRIDLFTTIRGMRCGPGTRWNDAGRHRRRVSRMARFQQTLRRLAMGDEAFVQDEAEPGLDRAGTSAPHPRTAALLRLGGAAAIGSSPACLEWSGAHPRRLRYFRNWDPAER